MQKIINESAIERRNLWVEKIGTMNGVFAEDANALEGVLKAEIKNEGYSTLLNHIRLSGNIPESYHHDSSEEKQYSKYTDAILACAYEEIGLNSHVITERADVADVEAVGKKFSLVADAKAFRLSRTAKNQKDFKVAAMDRWKHGKEFAMVVCPIYQLPKRTSQIYNEAIIRNVCIFTYSHLALLVRYAKEVSTGKAEDLLYEILSIVPALNPSKCAVAYWLAVNKTILSKQKIIKELWREEKIASNESIIIAKEEAIIYLTAEREKIMRMSHDEALKALIKFSKVDTKIETIKKIADNGLFSIS